MIVGGFTYYIPGAKSVTDELVTRKNLEYAITARGGREVLHGPDGSFGVAIRSDGKSAGYFPDKQKWCEAPRGDEDAAPYWVGYDLDDPPTPEDLDRGEKLLGQAITLQDGSTWNVPILCMWHEGEDRPAYYEVTLPCLIDIDHYGRCVSGPVLPKYKDLFDVGLRVLVQMTNRGLDSFSQQQILQFALDVLGLQYRVSLLEMSSRCLGIVSLDDAFQIVRIAIQLDDYRELVKNWGGRQARPDIDTNSGAEQQTTEDNLATAQQ